MQFYGDGCPPLAPGTEIELVSISDSDNKYTRRFTVREVCGRGGMSYVYTVEDSDCFWTLKEYCPKSLFSDPCAVSRNGTELVVKPEYREKYGEYMDNLMRASTYHNRYMKQNVHANMSNVNQAGFFEGNNTKYVLSVYNDGASYDKVADRDVNFMFRVILAAAKAVKQYHDNGILLVDIKPENILVLKDGDGWYADIIKLFDYDSMVTLDYALENRGKLIVSPCAPAELKYRCIGAPDYNSDIFLLGAMVYKRIHGYEHVSAVANGCGSYCDGSKGTLLYGASASLISAVNDFLSRTLVNDQRRRFQNIDDVIDELTRLVSMSAPGHIYLKDKRRKPSEKFSGRQTELAEIQRRLTKDGFVFLYAMGGAGKTQLAKKFAQVYKNVYHTCQFVYFDTGIKETVGALDFANLSESKFDGDSEELIKQKWDNLDLCDSRTLIIVDNIEVLSEPELEELLTNGQCRAKFIFTTRCKINKFEHQTYELPKLSPTDCRELFFKHCVCTDTEKREYSPAVETLSVLCDGNPLLICLIADITENSMGLYTPDDILFAIKNADYDEMDFAVGGILEDCDLCINDDTTVMNLLFEIFRLSNLDRREFMILNNLSLIPISGINCIDFIKKSGFPKNYFTVINKLACSGWIEADMTDNRISAHPLIGDLVSLLYAKSTEKDDIYGEYEEYGNLINSVCGYIADDSDNSLASVRDRVAFARNLKRRCSIAMGAGHKTAVPLYELDIAAGRLLLSVRDYYGAQVYLKTAEDEMKNYDHVSYVSKITAAVLRCRALSSCGKYGKAHKCIDRAVKYAVSHNAECDENRRISVSSLLIIKGEIFDLQGAYDDAVGIYQNILDAEGFVFSGTDSDIDNELIAAALFHLGNSFSDKGDTEKAQKYLDTELAYSVKNYGEDSVNTAVTLAEIAENRLVSGDCVRALEDYDRAYRILRSCNGDDDPKTRSIYYAKIGVLALLGELDEAVSGSLEYVEHCCKTYGNDSVQTAYACKVSSEMLLQAGRIAEAGNMIERSVTVYGAILPKDNPDYATALLNKAEYLYTVGRISEASDIISDLLEIDLVSLADNAIFYANYISLLTLTGEYSKARRLCNEYISVAKTNRLNQLHLINGYTLMGNIYLREGRHRKALEMYGQSLETAQAMDFKGKINPNIWVCTSNMGVAHLGLGLFSRAKHELEMSIEQLEKFYPDGHQSLVNIYINIGKCCFALGEAMNALDWYKKAEELMTALGICNESDVMLRLNRGLVYDSLGDVDTAVEMCGSAYAAASKLWREDNAQKAVILADLGLYTARLRDVSEGIEIIKKAMAMVENRSEKFFYIKAVINHYLSDAYGYPGDYDTARKFIKEAIRLMINNCDEWDIRIVDFYGELASVCVNAGDHDGAVHALTDGLKRLCGGYSSLPPSDRVNRLVMLLSALGHVYSLKGDMNTGNFFASGALKLSDCEWFDNESLRADVLTVLGDIELNCNKADSAKEFYEQALDIFANRLTGGNGECARMLKLRLSLL